MTKTFEEEFNYLIELSGKVLIGQVDAEVFEKNRIAFFEKYETDQHQPLPVVPEFVAEHIEEFRKSNAFHSIKNLVSGDEYYTYPGLSDEVKNWISENIAHQELLVRAWLDGYTVQKPKRFYLREELTGQFLANDNYLKNEDRYFFWTGADPLTHSIGTAWKLTFTQEEIDSMQTGSYEKIEVEK